jgi:hypothetical protein
MTPVTLETTPSQRPARPESLTGPRPSPPHPGPAARVEHPEADWGQLLRALRGSDEDDLPLFGRLPA